MGLLKSIFRTKKLKDVFTPARYAIENYVKRSKLQTKIQAAIDAPGVQVVIYGNSGCGKSSLLNNTLVDKKKFLITQCIEGLSFDQIIEQAFQDLGTVVDTKYSNTSSAKIGGGIQKKDVAHVSGEVLSSTEVGSEPLVKPKGDVYTLVKTLGKEGKIWIIDDFHNLSKPEQKSLAGCMKLFVDNSNKFQKCKIICVGATDNPSELLTYNRNLSVRVQNLRVDDMSDQEIRDIVIKGCDMLNISFSEESINNIVKYSHHLPAVAHNLCYLTCLDAGIKKTKMRRLHIEDKHLNNAIQEYLDSNAALFTQLSNSVLSDASLKAVVQLFINDNLDSISLASIEKSLLRKGFSKDQVQNAILKLSDPKLAVLRYEENKQKYYFTDEFVRVYLGLFLDLNKDENDKEKVIMKNVNDLSEAYFNITLSILNNIISKSGKDGSL